MLSVSGPIDHGPIDALSAVDENSQRVHRNGGHFYGLPDRVAILLPAERLFFPPDCILLSVHGGNGP